MRRSFLVWVWVTATCANVAVAQTRGASAPRASEPGDALAVQVYLQRANFSPGEIDGQYGLNTDKAIAAFAAARGRGPQPVTRGSRRSVPRTCRS